MKIQRRLDLRPINDLDQQLGRRPDERVLLALGHDGNAGCFNGS